MTDERRYEHKVYPHGDKATPTGRPYEVSTFAGDNITSQMAQTIEHEPVPGGFTRLRNKVARPLAFAFGAAALAVVGFGLEANLYPVGPRATEFSDKPTSARECPNPFPDNLTAALRQTWRQLSASLGGLPATPTQIAACHRMTRRLGGNSF